MRASLVVVAGAVLAALAVALLVVAGARAVVDAQRGRLLARARAALGRSLAVAEIAPSFWPLGIRLGGVTIGDDPAFGAAPFLEAEAAVVTVRAWPLVRGRLEASGVVLRAPVVRLIRDERGRWNVATLGGEDEARPPTAPGTRARGPRLPPAVGLGVLAGEVRRGTVELVDRAAARPRTLVVRAIGMRVQNVHAGGDARVTIEAALFAERPNLRLELHLPALGASDPRDTPFELDGEATGVELAAIGQALAGTRAERLTLAARGTPARFAVTLDAAWTRDAVPGALRLRGRREDDRFVLAQAGGSVGDLAWEAEGVVARAGDGARIEAGRVVLQDVALEVAGRVWGGDLPTLDLRVAGHPFGGDLAGTVTGDAAQVRLRGRFEAVDAGAVAARLGLEGSARLEGAASGTLDLTAGPDGVAGAGEIAVTGGRIDGVNLATEVLGLLDVPLLPALLGAPAGHPRLLGESDTVIETVTIPFTVVGGRVRSEDVRLVGRTFEIAGGGWVDRDRHVRFAGDLVLAPDVSDGVVAEVRMLRYLRRDDRRVSVPFRVRGRLGKARLEPDWRRLRERGLALLSRRRRPEKAPAGDRPRPERDLGDALLEQLERALEP